MEQKIRQFCELKLKAAEIKTALEFLEEEIKDSITKPVMFDWYVLNKRSRTNYKLREGVDLEMIEREYPSCVSKRYDAKEAYKLSDNPTEIVNKTISEYLELKSSKKKEDTIDF